ncbi:uncharacterized protein [Prorops nasuta]|uniref:uncharacterized protein n=1 Tax=Prorops nasuta TaxID=863751 RepID=UPI0034CFA03E
MLNGKKRKEFGGHPTSNTKTLMMRKGGPQLGAINILLIFLIFNYYNFYVTPTPSPPGPRILTATLLMDMTQGFSNSGYYAILNNIYISASTVYENALSLAVTKEKELNKEAGKPEDEFTVSGDGSWKKRGFSSLFGVSTLIAKYSGKVVDTCVQSSFCQGCLLWKNKKNDDPYGYEEWLASHENCTINHTGSSGKMEIDAIVKMFSHSTDKHNVKYLTYVGDGDSKTFKGILDSQPYGEKCVVIKKECVGHVEKRMGTRLRNAKKANKGIGGKGEGKLTDKVIGELTKYYGLAIRRHPDSIADMKREIWATFYHYISTNDKPQHQNCPSGENSWCKWRRAEFLGITDEFQHEKKPLSKEVQKIIRPIYEDLSKEDLLIRCLGAETQNNNESLNSLIWTFAPKHLHSGAKVVELATYLAVLIFNEGFQPILKIMEIMGADIGINAQGFVHNRDNSRIERSEKRISDFVKQARISNREEKNELRHFYEEEEGVLYGPGIAN